MPRPHCCRRVAGKPMASIFKPAGIPARYLDEVRLTLDEYEALRLADLEGLYQENAALRMEVSRPTFGRILEVAHRKVAEALVKGKALRIEGGPVYAEPASPYLEHQAVSGQTILSPARGPKAITAPANADRSRHRAGRIDGAIVYEYPDKEDRT